MTRRLLATIVLCLLPAVASAQRTVTGDAFRLTTGPCTLSSDTMDPEGAKTGKVCDEYKNATTGTRWVKTSGTGATGWSQYVVGVVSGGTITFPNNITVASADATVQVEATSGRPMVWWRIGANVWSESVDPPDQGYRFLWFNGGDRMSLMPNGDLRTYGSTTANGGFFGALTGNVTGNASGSAATFTGSLAGDVTGAMAATVVGDDSHAHTGSTLSGIGNASIAAAAGIVDTKLATIATAGKVSNSATTAASANTASAIVARDSSGDFAAHIVTAALSGNATTATSLSSNQGTTTTVLHGDASGAPAWGSIVNGDVAAAAGIVDTKLATIATAGKVSNSATTATSANTASAIVARDGDGSVAVATGTFGADVMPAVAYTSNVGSIPLKMLTGNFAELRASTLVSSSTIATQGGRILTAPSTVLSAALTDTATSISVKHNNLLSGDRVYLEANGAVEFMAVTSPVTQGYAAAVRGDEPVGYWRLGEASGTTAVDASGNGHDGTYSGVTLGTTGALSDGTKAITVDGGNTSLVYIATMPASPVSACSIEAWVNPATLLLPTGNRMWFGTNASGATYISLGNESGFSQHRASLYLSGVQETVLSDVIAQVGRWDHVVVTYSSGDYLRVYVNGVLHGTSATTLTGSVDLLDALSFGTWIVGVSDYNFIGSIDEPAVYNYALTSTQIAAHYALRTGTGLTGPYRYAVTRDLDGTGANTWYAGDAVVSQGTTGSGWIDQYADRSVLGTGYGPTTAYMVRTGTAYNAVAPRTVIGNLRGWYDVTTDIYGLAAGDYAHAWLSVDPTNGLRMLKNGSTVVMQITPAGAASFTGSVTVTGGDAATQTYAAGQATAAAATVTTTSIGAATTGALATVSGVANAAETPTGAQTKASTAQSNAISAASGDATSKANAAQSAAISTASGDATTKANDAISTAASDAATKAGAAETNAKSYADGLIPATVKAPSGTGLFLSSTNLGYYSAGTWKTYMDSTGNLVLGNVTGGQAGLSWNQGTGALAIKGTITVTGGDAATQTYAAGQATAAAAAVTTTSIGAATTGALAAVSGVANAAETPTGAQAKAAAAAAAVTTTTIGAATTGALATVSTAAATADGKAVTAQGTANTGVTNAATADGKAVTALANAATADGKAVTAKSTADTAVTNAATAQATANAAETPAGALAKAYSAQTTAAADATYKANTVATASLDKTTYLTASTTTIAGGKITTGSVTATQLDFVPATSTNVIAKINASAEGLDVSADRISIDGTTTFSSGYDPTGKIASGGARADTGWAHASNTTLIDGGDIYSHSVTTTQLAATAIDAMTITGALIRTAAVGAWPRVQIDSTGIYGYGPDGMTAQWMSQNASGRLYAGGGNIILDATGITAGTGGTYDSTGAYKFKNIANDTGQLDLSAYSAGAYKDLFLTNYVVNGTPANVTARTTIRAKGTSTSGARTEASMVLSSPPTDLTTFDVTAAASTFSGTVSANGLGTHNFYAGGAGGNVLAITNATDGGGNYSRFAVVAGTTDGDLTALPQSFSTSGTFVAGGITLNSAGAGGLSIAASHASGAIRFYAGGGTTLRGSFDASGNFVPGVNATNGLGDSTHKWNYPFVNLHSASDHAGGTPVMTGSTGELSYFDYTPKSGTCGVAQMTFQNGILTACTLAEAMPEPDLTLAGVLSELAALRAEVARLSSGLGRQ